MIVTHILAKVSNIYENRVDNQIKKELEQYTKEIIESVKRESNKTKIEEIKRDFSRRNSIIYKEYEFLKEYGRRPNELRVSIDFYNEMSSDVEIAFDIIFNEDLTKSYRDMNIIIDNSIEGLEVSVNG
ncbi:hypothetical protein [Clostridium saccharoperbutylacetonicum]|uniref:hypothetical protein n=1 Tax=Clostridium saccharoperbutylacetonicum TaxID=36745 RepID=UPI0039EC1778